jgi:RNA polymerase sigma-70 factor (ECF subfamily)
MIAQMETTMTNLTAAAIESHRKELTRYCAQRLGSPYDAEDAVQETLLRAWRSADRLQKPDALRGWLYRIAGNVCIDSFHRLARQPVPTSDCSEIVGGLAEPDPAELALNREDLRLALTAAVHHLPPRQRAVLILREILCWPAAEVADFMTTSVAAVNSALQRAHATLERTAAEQLPSGEDELRSGLVARYLGAFEADDIDALTTLSWSERSRTDRLSQPSAPGEALACAGLPTMSARGGVPPRRRRHRDARTLTPGGRIVISDNGAATA